jgi:GNAT superfamily N-acetyltransferase
VSIALVVGAAGGKGRGAEQGRGMSWTITDDPEAFAAAALPLLLADPVANTVALTVLNSLRGGHQFGEQPAMLAWYTEHDQVTGAVLQTPPFGLLLVVLPAGSEPELVEQLRRDGRPIPDANGAEETVQRFSSCWVAGTQLTVEPWIRQRLFRLADLCPPQPAPAGSARPAGRPDEDLVMNWMQAFQDEAEPRDGEPNRRLHQHRIDHRLTWLWLDERGDPVSLAGRNVTVAGVSRIGPVYTPPEHRRHGYAAGVTAACSQHALDTGAEQVILFTDLSNPTSNGVYQRLGYRPIGDRLILRYR